jgi:hypothetical protein
MSGTTNICELPKNVVTNSNPNVVTGLDPNSTRCGVVVVNWATMDDKLPANRIPLKRKRVSSNDFKLEVRRFSMGAFQSGSAVLDRSMYRMRSTIPMHDASILSRRHAR